MKHLFTINAPDGSVEYVGPRGEVLTQHTALPWRGTLDEAQDELERRAKLWSVRGDCHIREPKIVAT